jgi:cell division transport system permease protein
MKPGFFVREALRSIRANVAISMAATVTVMIAVFILGAFIPSFLYVQSTVDSQKKRLDVNVYISNSATDQQVAGLQANIERLKKDGLVSSYTYVSKDDALKDLKSRMRDPDVLARFIQYAGLALIGILLIAAVLLIGNTIRLSIFARRREVEVMRLVGATNWFIRWPFVIEGIICGIVGAAVSIVLLFAAKVAVVDQFVTDNAGALTRDQATTIGFIWLGLLLVVAGGLVGALGSGITLRRFLRV